MPGELFSAGNFQYQNYICSRVDGGDNNFWSFGNISLFSATSDFSSNFTPRWDQTT